MYITDIKELENFIIDEYKIFHPQRNPKADIIAYISSNGIDSVYDVFYDENTGQYIDGYGMPCEYAITECMLTTPSKQKIEEMEKRDNTLLCAEFYYKAVIHLPIKEYLSGDLRIYIESISHKRMKGFVTTTDYVAADDEIALNCQLWQTSKLNRKCVNIDEIPDYLDAKIVFKS